MVLKAVWSIPYPVLTSQVGALVEEVWRRIAVTDFDLKECMLLLAEISAKIP
jgi:hypothetical protein